MTKGVAHDVCSQAKVCPLICAEFRFVEILMRFTRRLGGGFELNSAVNGGSDRLGLARIEPKRDRRRICPVSPMWQNLR
jgi:hypothetical protein